MPSLIINPNRTEVSRSFPVLGFTVRVAKTPAWFEIVLATDPALFRPDARARRTPSTFFSTRGIGPLPAEHNEAVFLVPAAVLDRFAGQEKLYYAAARSEKADLTDADVALAPLQASPSVYLSGSLANASRRLTFRPNPRGGLNGKGDSYQTGGDSLTWAGDEAMPGHTEPVATHAATGQAPATAPVGAPARGESHPTAAQTALLGGSLDTTYDDGFSPAAPASSQSPAAATDPADDDSSHDIGGPAPDEASARMIAAQSLSKPDVPPLTREHIVQLMEQVGVPHDQQAICGAICDAESGRRANATGINRNKGGQETSRDRGLWQINSKAHPEVTESMAYDPLGNAQAMARISGGGTNWHPWATYNSDAYRRYLPAYDAILGAQRTTDSASPKAQSLDAPSPDYPGASRFDPASPGNYRVVPADRPRPIDRVVIHITDGGPQIGGTISWFKDPKAKVSAHYVVGRDGEVVQMVAHKDVAWHAGPANGDSIGIEHVAHSGTMYPTEQEYCASAALVKWICQHNDIPLDRQHVLGHHEADTRTTHTGCPDAAWDWEHYWSVVTGPDCLPAAATASSMAGDLFYNVELVPQPDKLSCWAASMAMLVGFARRMSITAEDLAQEVGRSLRTSYGWDMLEQVKDRFGITAIKLPSNASLYPPPEQWYQWLDSYGPLWITTVGSPSHAIVVRGISGDLTPAGTTLSILNPWDLSTNFDNDEIDFHPANRGREYSQSFADFAADFGRLGLDDYGSWRVLYIPSHVTRVEPDTKPQPELAGSTPSQNAAQSFAASTTTTGLAGVLVPVATTIAGAVMNQLVKSDGSVTWTLMQLDGLKRPHDDQAQEGSTQWTQHKLTVAGPRLESHAGLKQGADFEVRWQTNGNSVGNVTISNVGVDDWLLGTLHVDARIRNEAQVYTDHEGKAQIAGVHVLFDYTFHRRLQSDYSCLTTLTLFGNGDTSQEYDWWRQAA